MISLAFRILACLFLIVSLVQTKPIAFRAYSVAGFACYAIYADLSKMWVEGCVCLVFEFISVYFLVKLYTTRSVRSDFDSSSDNSLLNVPDIQSVKMKR